MPTKNVQPSANASSWAPRMRNCRRLRKTKVPECVTVDNSEKLRSYRRQMQIHKKSCRQLHNLAPVTQSGTLAFRKRRQLRILGGQELAFADSYTCFVGSGDPDHGLWLAARASDIGKDWVWGVYVTDPVAPTFWGP